MANDDSPQLATDSLDNYNSVDLFQSLTECYESLVAQDAFLTLEHYWSSTAGDMRQRLIGLENDEARLRGRENNVLELARKAGLDDDDNNDKVGGGSSEGTSMSYTRRTILQLRGILLGTDQYEEEDDEALAAPTTLTMGNPDAECILRKMQLPRYHKDRYFRSQDRW